jgi:hypothetical protein
MMGEPELEEETLTATAEGQRLSILRRTLGDSVGPLSVTAPDGSVAELALTEVAPGEWRADWDAPELGLYRLREGDLDAVVALGPPAPREFEQTIATSDVLAPLIDSQRGGVVRVEDGLPDLRLVAEGRVAAGRGWLGLTPRNAFVTRDLTVAALLPGWAWLLLAAGLALGAWLREGR